jgi:hypothetical protein
MNIDQPNSVLYPGSFVQGKSIKTGAEPLERIPITANDRFPIQIVGSEGYIADAVATADAVIGEIRRNLIPHDNVVWLGFAKTS